VFAFIVIHESSLHLPIYGIFFTHGNIRLVGGLGFLGLYLLMTGMPVLVFRSNQDLLNRRFKLPRSEGQPCRQDSRRLVGFALLWRDSAHSVRCVPVHWFARKPERSYPALGLLLLLAVDRPTIVSGNPFTKSR